MLPGLPPAFPGAHPPAPTCARDACRGSFPSLNVISCRLGPGGHAWPGASGLVKDLFSGLGQTPRQFSLALTLLVPGPLESWSAWEAGSSEPSPTQFPGTDLRWLCVGSGWGGRAAAACGTCPRRGSPAAEQGVGIHPSCSGAAGAGGQPVSASAPSWDWLNEARSHAFPSYLVPPRGPVDGGGALPGLFSVCQPQAWVSKVSGAPLPAWRAWGVGGIGHEARRQQDLPGYALYPLRPLLGIPLLG